MLRPEEETFPLDVVRTGIEKATKDYVITGTAAIMDGSTGESLWENHAEVE